MAEHISEETVIDQPLQLSEITTPSNPSANGLKVYPKDVSGTTRLAILDSSGTETILGSSSASFFNQIFGGTLAAWSVSGPLAYEPSTASFTGGIFMDIAGDVIGADFLRQSQAAAGSASVGTVLANGNKVELVTAIKITSHGTLGANQLAGVGLGNRLPDKVTTGMGIFVGADSAGDIYLVVANGSSVVVADTGVNNLGAIMRIKIVWIRGTSVTVTIDGNSPTVHGAASIPTSIFGHRAGTGTGSATVRAYGGFFRISRS